jgi:hypothetical protein
MAHAWTHAQRLGGDNGNRDPGGGNGQGGTRGNGVGGTGEGREFLCFFHPDHLGSSSYVTDEAAFALSRVPGLGIVRRICVAGASSCSTLVCLSSAHAKSVIGPRFIGGRFV